jgi:hypothetical protein
MWGNKYQYGNVFVVNSEMLMGWIVLEVSGFDVLLHVTF